jgi:hypothetical protein
MIQCCVALPFANVPAKCVRAVWLVSGSLLAFDGSPSVNVCCKQMRLRLHCALDQVHLWGALAAADFFLRSAA